MEVKKGYKQTEIGIIPEDWEVNKLRDCLLEAPDYGVNASAVDYTDNLPTYLRITDITDEGYFSPERKASVDYQGIDRFFLRNGDLVFARTGASVGKSYLYNSKDGILAFAGYLIRVKTDPSKLIPEYLANYVQTKRYWNWVQVMSMRSGQPGINGNEYGQLPIPLPKNIDEQRAIAAALSDVDALLTALDALIAKKRNIKQGAMQELLTGKRRLSGFSGEWEVKRLGEIFDITAGGDFDPTRSSEIQGENFPYPIYSNAITDNGIYGYCSYNNHQAGSITVTARGTLGAANFRDHDFTAIGRVLVLKPNQPLDGRFFSEFINNRIDFVVESTGVPQLTAPQISTYDIPFPEYPEQQAIAEILSDMDAEIAALEQRREKTRLLKQGMMQELLTGRIRLL